MKRLLFTLILLLSPLHSLVYAATTDLDFDYETDYLCPTSASYDFDDDADAISRIVSERDDKITSLQASCGEENANGLLERNDCSREGKFITEISESFGSSVSIPNEDGTADQVLDVYKGSCCFKGVEGDGNSAIQCDEYRTLYTKSYASCQSISSTKCELRQWIVSGTGTGILKIYIKFLYTWGAGIIGFIAVAVLIISGIQIQVSGVSGDISSAKNRILQSLAALALLFLSGLILYTVNPTFFS